MRRFVLVVIAIVLFCFPAATMANNEVDEDKWNELNHISDKVLQLVKQEKYEDAKKMLTYFSEQFLSIRYNNSNLTMSDLHIVTNSFEQVEGAVTGVSVPTDERILRATEFRLVVDALVTDGKPLWKNTEKSLFHSFHQMKETAEAGDNQALQHRINEFLRQYQVIRPAIMIDLEPQNFQRIQSHIAFLEKYRQDLLQDEQKLAQLEVIEKELHLLYDGIQEDGADPSLLWVMLTIGGMIFTSLSYVGFKKYKAEKQKVKVKE
ncbi:sporulation protein YpjB [Alkalihalobacillus sp. LMS39]|uniref:sporulation protein YpjB n=1 Tax=Alkalihalobacillus sp. LMS39 TaxID=2924032 RepID=UPI001FB289C9|nr:sporulation protein YpjB [Alkalihalobacillus sp. LMS39]UOE92322.1 sporulation protein YpjB [Alkalihalobacillus sp. LMS39]